MPPLRDAPHRLDDEAGVVARAQAGDVAAFEILYLASSGRVFALCLRMSGDRTRARELTHDVFVRAWERLASFRGESAFTTWLHRLAVNVVLEAERSDRRRQARVALADDTRVVGGARDGDDDDGERGVELMAAPVARDVDASIDLDRAIAALPPNARRVFVLHDVEGYKHEEIAAAMSIAQGTVRAHLFRARRLLMEWLSR